MCFFRCTVLFVVIAAPASRNHVNPGVSSAAGSRQDMVAAQILILKFLSAIHAKILISPEENAISQRRFLGLAVMQFTGTGNDAVQ